MEQSDLLRIAVDTLERLKINYAIVGSFASGIWGETRFTQDIDVLIDVKPAQVGDLCRAFPEADFYASDTAARDAVLHHGQFNVIHPSSGNKIDFMIAGGKPWADAQMNRRRFVQVFPNRSAAVAAPEDVILGKLIYYQEGGSEKHLRDIAGIMKISDQLIDRDYIALTAGRLGISEAWNTICRFIDK